VTSVRIAGTVSMPTPSRSLVARFTVGLLALAALLAPGHAAAQPHSCAPNCQFLTAADVTNVVRGAATAISSTNIIVAVVDRTGVPLAVYLGPTATAADVIEGGINGRLYPPAGAVGPFTINAQDYAVGLARTGAFFSNNQAPLSSRTVRMISGIHFPPGIANKPPAALYGIENTNRGCSFNVAAGSPIDAIPRATSVVNGATCENGTITGCGSGIVTGKRDIFDSDPGSVDGGGIPLFKAGQVVGGVGVTGIGIEKNVAEFAAFSGVVAGGFGPSVPDPGVIFLDGIALPFVKNQTRPPGVGAGVFVPNFTVGPIDSPNLGNGVPEHYLFGPIASTTPAPAAGGLSAAEVGNIVDSARRQAFNTRAAIRLPLGSTTRMMISVSDAAGNILAIYRMPDATIFSIDVSVAKARNAVYFSSPTRNPVDLPGVPLGTSVTARTIGFGAQPLYPAGLDNTRSGPFFGDFMTDVDNPCSQGFQPGADANRSGIVFFPGSIGLYRGRTASGLIGGLGVSGDGVEQDDFVTAAGVSLGTDQQNNFVPALEIRADRVIIGDVRLPYFKFPRNPEVK
jgi:uncharacterized protein GlcG (DUF336 family)